MTNLSKRKIVLSICDKMPNVLQHDITKIVQLTLDNIADALSEGRNVELRRFGVFEVIRVKPRRGCNPRKPEQKVAIPAQNKVKFSAGKVLKQRVLLLTESQLSEKEK